MWRTRANGRASRGGPLPQRVGRLGVTGLLAVAVLLAAAGSAHANVALVQKASNASSGAATSISATFSSTPTQGNLLVAVAGNRDSSTPQTPGGWSVAITETANTPGQVVFYKIAGSGEPTTVTVSSYSVSTRLGLHIYEYRGIDKKDPLDRTVSNTGTGTSLSVGPTAATRAAREAVLAAFTVNSDSQFSGWTNGFVEQNDFRNTGSASQISAYGGADLIVTTTGTYSTAASAGSGGDWRGQIVTFRGARRVMMIGAGPPSGARRTMSARSVP